MALSTRGQGFRVGRDGALEVFEVREDPRADPDDKRRARAREAWRGARPSVEAADPGRVGLDDEADDAEARPLKARSLVDELDAKARGFAFELAATAGGGGDLRDGHVHLLELILAAREVAPAVAGGDGERQEIALADVEEGLRDEDWRGIARVGHAGTGAEAAQARLHRNRAPPGGRVIAVVGLFRARQD